ncbi:MAG: leucyl/phenylalanyl-tRNA--protein transferase [Nitrosospira sp. 56-18]|jgi:leucyl/phenylalanyl-tRNA--protein transferase|nr:leucyl/phenylalanyl-tRNA--protein transferase [Nitrosospira sp.]OJY14379.1 MAG: leucyl/phenylalanyl-tRNA--protein transferase [Nitrosospira sp. 56-18]
MIPWLDPASRFPPLHAALREPNGLLAAGGDLSPQRLIEAYRSGIFPWFNSGEPVLWWSPDPRMVLFPDQIKISRSLRKILTKGGYEVRVDSAFREVMEACGAPRRKQAGTWIHPEMVSAYSTLHEMGGAHSVEIWIGGELAGGLYGIAQGRAFFGESMFSRVPNTSKIALVHLARQLQRWGFGMIDCQMKTAHLASLGATEIAREEFSQRLKELVNYPVRAEKWCFDNEPAE